MRGLSDAQRAALTTAVDQLAWTAAREMLELEPDAGPRSDLPDADLRQMWLAALTSLLAIRESAEQLAASAALSAAQRGADYPAIGDAAGMTRQGARRKWPGLAGLAEGQQRKLKWWNSRGDQFTECVRAVLAATEGQRESPWQADLRKRLTEIEKASPAQRIDAFDMVVVAAHAVALRSPTPADPTAVLAIGLLAALTADAYAATNTHASLIIRGDIACGADDCPADPVVELLRPDIAHEAVPACHQHAVDALRQADSRIVAAYQQNVALSVFAEAHGE
ncbi:hypothetical protein ITP53_10635 [Nonomuraea sp. K274]|uniref:Uncharacterized protein n=1 Tax=Nonomuraea cypriaca TaxID=1187855 RepID=A0A931A716_9ACTN|nr:hypothetical protein [Nonomuraea cypriaca]MBF8186195.1 hypothetical protein [Nonomuraea cypriaca]